MDWTTPSETPPVWAPPETPAPAPEAVTSPASDRLGGMKRTVATALLAVGLLTIGGVAVVNAADAAATPPPNATTQPSTGGGTTEPPSPGTNGVTPRGQAPSGRAGHDCPNMGGSGSGSSNPGTGGSTAPSAGSSESTTNL
jgi:hypothetical protein